MKRMLKWAGVCLVGLAVLWVALATAMAFSPAPALRHPQKPRPDTRSCGESTEVRCFAARDGARLAARRLAAQGSDTIVLFLHGVLSSSAEHLDTAGMLREALRADVVSLDLRGHGLSEGRPGDVDAIGQYEDDVADVVAALRRERPGARVLLSGHSMGGGIALRYAARRNEPGVDGYLLFAPLLGYEAPTERRAEAGAKGSDEALIKVHVPRLLGLVMLNAVGLRVLNGLPTLYFDVPAGLPAPAYSFRAMSSMAPADYRAALSADGKPMLVVVGEKDEAFLAREYPAVIAAHTGAHTVIVPGDSHDGVTRSATAFAAVGEWWGHATIDLSHVRAERR